MITENIRTNQQFVCQWIHELSKISYQIIPSRQIACNRKCLIHIHCHASGMIADLMPD